MTLSVTYTVVDGELLSENRNGLKSDYIPDPQGSTAALINAEHVITDTFSYWPYGELRSHVGSSVTPYGYTGALGVYTDSQSNRIYEEARVYRPQTTVWHTVDPIWPRQRAYVYCDSNPSTYVDPNGRQGVWGGVGGAAAGLALCLIYNWNFGGTPYDNCLSCCVGVLGGAAGGFCTGGGQFGLLGGTVSGGLLGVAICPTLCGKGSSNHPRQDYQHCMGGCLRGCTDDPKDCQIRCGDQCAHWLNSVS